MGGHFGAAVGASTKRQKENSWRQELDEEEAASTNGVANGKSHKGDAGPAPLAVLTGVEDGSESEDMVDPGTPLPSDPEDDDEQGARAAAGDSSDVAVDATVLLGPSSDQSAAGSAASASAATTTRREQTPLSSQASSAEEATFELVVGETISGSLRILFPGGIDSGTESRLAACEPPDGAAVDAVVRGSFCTFGGHSSVPARPHSSAGMDPQTIHSCEGLLSVPRNQPAGLLLTLGPQPQLDASHQALGKVLQGRRVLRRLEALAPCFSTAELKPRIAPLILRRARNSAPGGTAAQQPDDISVKSPPQSEAAAVVATSSIVAEAGGDGHEVTNGHGHNGSVQPSEDPAGAPAAPSNHPLAHDEDELDAAAAAAEILDVAELEINGREAEVTELKQMTFSRERVEGVAAVEEHLGMLGQRLAGLDSLDEALVFQRSWLQERIRHLLRLLSKLK